MSDRYPVKRLDPKHWGSTISGPSGRVYLINPTSGQLHLTEGTKFTRTPGCILIDAKEFSDFPTTFKVGPLPKTRKALPPKKAAVPSEDEAPADTDPGAAPSLGAFPEDLPDVAESKANWIDWALQEGIELTLNEQKFKKVDLLKIIKERAREPEE